MGPSHGILHQVSRILHVGFVYAVLRAYLMIVCAYFLLM